MIEFIHLGHRVFLGAMVLPVAVIDKVLFLGGARVAFVALVIVKPLPPLNTKRDTSNVLENPMGAQ